MPPAFRLFALPALVAVAGGCGQGDAAHFALSGSAMGTSWHVTVVADAAAVGAETLEADVAAAIATVEQSMSTYIEESDLSRFNRRASTDWQAVPEEFCRAVESALYLSEETGGAFDPTAGALVNLWGFGPDAVSFEPPPEAEVAAALARSGAGNLEADCSRPALRKGVAGLYVDLSAFAKGFAVDRVADVLDARSVANYLVEIGGELRVRGANPEGDEWRIAIETPDPATRRVHRVVSLTDTGLATSGDYRNFFEYEGRLYSHTIDPRSGRPVDHAAASVTVVAMPAARADALATALMVLGPEAGLEYAEREGLAALYLLRADDSLVERPTSRFLEEVGLL